MYCCIVTFIMFVFKWCNRCCCDYLKIYEQQVLWKNFKYLFISYKDNTYFVSALNNGSFSFATVSWLKISFDEYLSGGNGCNNYLFWFFHSFKVVIVCRPTEALKIIMKSLKYGFSIDRINISSLLLFQAH